MGMRVGGSPVLWAGLYISEGHCDGWKRRDLDPQELDSMTHDQHAAF